MRAVHNHLIRATATMTLTLPKIGFRTEGATAFTGELYAESKPALSVGPIFAKADWIRLS